MKKNIANFETFIIEQKAWFEENLAADFAESWDSFVWICGLKDPAGYVAMGLIYYVLMRLTGSKGLMIAIRIRALSVVHESDAGTRLSREKSQYFLCGCCRNADYFETMVLRSH